MQTLIQWYISMSQITKRIFDLALCLVIVPLLFLPLILLAVAVKFSSSGPAIYWSRRVGRNNRIFSMPKFRTMQVDTPQLLPICLKILPHTSPPWAHSSGVPVWTSYPSYGAFSRVT